MDRWNCVNIFGLVLMIVGLILIITGSVLTNNVYCYYGFNYIYNCESYTGYVVMIVIGIIAIIASCVCVAAARRMRWSNYSGQRQLRQGTVVAVQQPAYANSAYTTTSVATYPPDQRRTTYPYEGQYGAGQPAAYAYGTGGQSLSYPPNISDQTTSYPPPSGQDMGQPPNAPPPPYYEWNTPQDTAYNNAKYPPR